MAESKKIPIRLLSYVVPIKIEVIEEPWVVRAIPVLGTFRPIVAVIDMPVQASQ